MDSKELRKLYESIPATLQPVPRVLFRKWREVSGKKEYDNRISTMPEYNLDQKPDILFLVIDCLRADHMSYSGYGRNTTPFLDQFEVTLDSAISASPWTFSSVPSILSGYYPHNHGAILSDEFRNFEEQIPITQVKDDIYCISEILGAVGYSTYFSTAISTGSLSLKGRFENESLMDGTNASDMIDDLLTWWDSESGSSRFAYVHLGDLHAPLEIQDSAPFGDIDTTVGDIAEWEYRENTTPKKKFERYRFERLKLYDTLLSYVDNQIESLFKSLTERGDLEDTIIVVTGDHGEEFWEHVDTEKKNFYDPRGYYGVGHGHSLFQEVINVPLCISGIETNIRTDNWVSTVDIVPTILDSIEHEQSEIEFDGGSLLNHEDGTVLSEEIAYGYEQTAVFQNGYKLIHSPGNNTNLLYDLEADPDEKEDISHTVEGKRILSNLVTSIPDDKVEGDSIDLDQEARNRLDNLGYL